MLMTANPCADAERWENEMDRRAAAADEARARAMQKLQRAAAFMTPVDWFHERMPGPFGLPMSFDEMLAEAIADGDHDSITALGALMVSQPALQLRTAVMAHIANRYPEGINAA
ncbi:MAG: hypothetical protein ACN6PP_00710 [Delftia tsuruhatensis]